MKYLIKFIVLFVTWPLILVALLFVSLLWLGCYCWGNSDEDFLGIMKYMVYLLWHFKVKKDE